jgi:hypothetical protein
MEISFMKKQVFLHFLFICMGVCQLVAQNQSVSPNASIDTTIKTKPSVNYSQIEGIVYDKNTSKPMPFAYVWIEINGNGYSGSSNKDGVFKFNVHSLFQHNDSIMTVDIIIQSIGFDKRIIKSATIVKGKSLQLNIVELQSENPCNVTSRKFTYDFIGDPDYHRRTTIKREEINGIPKNR